ncbi:MAG: DUF952 domain-containing protein [Chloroflexota bacterium]|nr:DUF952 domain-containing protein [Chloroflexota bacterium]
MSHFYHIIDRAAWQQAQAAGTYRPESLTSEGFIHCSYAAQILLPANAFYRGRPNLVLLEIDPAQVQAELRHDPVEVVRNGLPAQEAFPHIYGPLNPTAVVRTISFPPDADGGFRLPEEI